MNRALVFPGQGSQFVGMGKEVYDTFAEARLVFEEVDDALNQNLTKIIFEGPMEDLTQTQNTQPALMAVSVALMRAIEKQSGKKLHELCSYVAGHSLGEYSALCAAGAFSLADTARLLRIRGNAMAEAVPAGKGGMAALIGVEFEAAAKLAESVSDVGQCQAANDNGGGQVVISGEMAAIDKAVAVASEFGIKRAVKLPVSAPFHSKMMQPAAQIMADALAKVEVKKPSVPVIANVTADIVTNPDDIRKLLVEQVTGMVRWRESVINLKNKGVTEIIEVGAGKVLSGLVKRIEKDIETSSIQTPADIEVLLAKA
ncbi:MAG: fabD [Rickettsiaceae bacterium]|jgi:[acyl-carrier-protein] S-malonyltransferase|nr:fabD [Rickettsiaceae bacterium]